MESENANSMQLTSRKSHDLELVLTKEQLEVELYTEKLSLKQIAIKYGCSADTISRYLGIQLKQVLMYNPMYRCIGISF